MKAHSMKTASPFGIVWIRQGGEVAQRGVASPQLGDYGTCARIVDWDQLPNGLLGITIEGTERFDLHATQSQANGLVMGQVALCAPPVPYKMSPGWLTLGDLLRSLETHPHVERMQLQVDYDDAWQVGYTLVQLLPLDNALKYALLGITEIGALMKQLHTLLNEISGEE